MNRTLEITRSPSGQYSYVIIDNGRIIVERQWAAFDKAGTLEQARARFGVADAVIVLCGEKLGRDF